MLRPPVDLARPIAVKPIPPLRDALWQPKADGWRVACFITEDGATIQTRSGRLVTDQFPELAAPLAALPAGTVLDGEAVAWRPDGDGEPALDFLSLARTPARRRVLGVSVQLLAFDLLCQDGEDVRGLPLSERWPRLLTVLDGAPAAVQSIVSTTDRAEAEEWAAALAARGFEGVVAKKLSAPYGQPRAWMKQRFADTTDGMVVEVVGGSALRLRLDDGREVTTEPLTRTQARDLAEYMATRPDDAGPLRVEVRIVVGRHGGVRYVRVRAAD